MSTITANDTKVITGKVRFSYLHAFEPASIKGGDEKYSVSLIIPKDDKKTISAINKAIEAAKQAVSSPLLETSIEGATSAIINITGGNSLTLFEAEDAAEIIRSAANTDINTIFGAVINENLNDEVIVTVIATGFEKQTEPIYSAFGSSRVERLNIDDDDDAEIPSIFRNRK